jgi:hypothetical protein
VGWMLFLSAATGGIVGGVVALLTVLAYLSARSEPDGRPYRLSTFPTDESAVGRIKLDAKHRREARAIRDRRRKEAEMKRKGIKPVKW